MALAGSGSPKASLKDSFAPGQRGRDGRVQRLDRVLVDVGRDRLTVDDLRDRLADGDVVHRLLLDVEDDVADLGAGTVDDLDALAAGLERLEVRRGEAAVGDVDVTLLDRQLQRRGLVEVLDDEVRRLRLVRAVVVRVDLEHGLLVGRELLELVRARADRLVVGLLRVGRVDLVRHDRRDVVGEDEGPRAVRLLEVHRHGGRIGRVDRLQRAQQRVRTGRVRDLHHAVERELDVLGRQRVAARELQVRLELADVRLRIREVAALGRVGFRLVTTRRNRQQVLVHVADQLLGAEVVCPDRVQRDDLVGGPEDHRVGVAAACRGSTRSRRSCCRHSSCHRPLLLSQAAPCSRIRPFVVRAYFRPPPVGTGSTSTSPKPIGRMAQRSVGQVSEPRRGSLDQRRNRV